MSKQTENHDLYEAHPEIHHEHTLFAEPIFHVGDFPVTNSLFNSWAVVLILLLLGLFLKSKIKTIPGKLQSAIEAAVEWFLDIFDFHRIVSIVWKCRQKRCDSVAGESRGARGKANKTGKGGSESGKEKGENKNREEVKGRNVQFGFQ